MNTIDTLFQELIALDPSFGKHEPEVRRLIAELLANKPNAPIDEAFVARLRAQLLGTPTPSPLSFFSTQYIALGVLAVLLVVPFGVYISTNRGGSSAVFSMNQDIERLASNAYGELHQDTGGKGGMGAVAANTQADYAVTAPAAAPATDAKVAAMAMTREEDARMMLPVGPVTSYTYTYTGEDLALPESGSVYQRTRTDNGSSQVASQLRKFNFGLLNLGAYSNAKVRSFELAEDGPYGYAISVNFDEGMISINPNYSQWPTLSGKEPVSQLPASAALPESEVLAIADKFIKDHRINTTNFAEPIVQGTGASSAAESQMQFAPDSVSVTYPLKIEGTKVLEDGAYPYGLQLSISTRDKRVMSLYGLSAQTYSSSEYKLVQDPEKVLSALRKGGPNMWVPEAQSGVQIKNVEIEVGAPEKILMHTYKYENGQSKELFVPALSFPVTKAPTGEEYYQKNIVIPLVPELLEGNQGGPVLYDMMR